MVTLCYLLLQVLNSIWFYILFVIPVCGTLAVWPIIINKLEEKQDRIRHNQGFRF